MTELDWEIGFLADHSGCIPRLVRGLMEAWSEPDTPNLRQRRTDKLHDHLNRSCLPTALVAMSGQQALGIVALRVHDLDSRTDLGPWLGGLFVVPEVRGRGLGSQLCLAAEKQALALGISELYLFTLDRQSMYQRLGWRPFCAERWNGRPGEILHRNLRASVP